MMMTLHACKPVDMSLPTPAMTITVTTKSLPTPAMTITVTKTTTNVSTTTKFTTNASTKTDASTATIVVYTAAITVAHAGAFGMRHA